MLTIIVFNAVQLLGSLYAVWRGGAPERLVAIMLLAAAGATAAVPLEVATSYRSVDPWIFGIDMLLLALLIFIAAVANRYWPMWLAALQLVTIAVHGVRVYNSDIWARAYWLVSGHIAYLVILVLIAGTARHRRRLVAGLPERSWSWQVKADGSRVERASHPCDGNVGSGGAGGKLADRLR